MDLLIRRGGLVLALAIAVGIAACSRDTDPPTFDNPFDPESPNAGEGYDLRAVVVGDAVQLTWFNVREQTGFPTDDSTLVDVYTIRHGTGTGEPTEQATGLVYPVAPAIGADILANHLDYLPEAVNTYRVQADAEPVTDSGGNVIGLDTYVPSRVVSVDAPLALTTPSGRFVAPSLDVPFRVRSGISTDVEFAVDAAFSVRDTILPIEPGVATEVTYRIVPFGAADDTLRVFFRGRTAASVGAARSVTITPEFDPGVQPQSGVRLNATRQAVAVDSTVVYRATGEGVTGVTLQIPVAEADPIDLFTLDAPDDPIVLPLDDARALNADSTAWNFQLAIDSELGFLRTSALTVRKAGPVTGASIAFTDEDGVTNERAVEVQVTAEAAGEMIFSERPDFAGASWRTFAAVDTVVLSEEFGEKTVYAGFRNAFDPGFVVTTATILLVPDEPPAAGTDPRR